ncbi:hypothetical protein G4G27_13205 [Sphingomonas sp. So64.6b]|uniref:hypothetical protein n=1 Tax=Sphingomonas sp. So64.6b TaxID=2997354 RepID=UPI0015FFE71C|nr:hypothetical protein [Sphingomonas sp. So64.6b]QNA84845.1 hypothetical protein G4G27_13205 [Sphingomonas sp. So64.6b]
MTWEDDAPIGTVGILVALVVVAEIAFGFFLLVAPGLTPSIAMMMGALAVSFASVVVVCLCKMPRQVRAILIAGLVIVLLALSGRSDLYGVRHIETESGESELEVDRPAAALSDRTRGGGSSAPDTQPAQSDAPIAQRGAQVAITPGENGDGGWSRTINIATNGVIGGADASNWRISGTATLNPGSPWDRLTLIWSIETNQGTTPCGMTTLLITDHAVATTQIASSFRKAIDHSIEIGRSVCF